MHTVLVILTKHCKNDGSLVDKSRHNGFSTQLSLCLWPIVYRGDVEVASVPVEAALHSSPSDNAIFIGERIEPAQCMCIDGEN